MDSYKKKQAVVNADLHQMGLQPPQAVELEEVVLGALMLETRAYLAVSDVLSPEVFYKEAHVKIYEAITDLVKASKPIDILTVTHQLRFKGDLESVGGALYVSQLANRVASTANIASHAKIILQAFLLREVAKMTSNFNRESYSHEVDVFDLLDKMQATLIKLSNDYIPSGQKTITEAIEQVGVEISERAEGNKPTGSILSSFVNVNKQTGGWYNSDLIILAARPGQGKTSLIISDALGMALRGEPVGVFSLEMSTTQLVYRIASQVTNIPIEDLTRSKLPLEVVNKFYSYVDKIKKLPMYFDDTPALSIGKLRAKAHKMKEKHGVKIIFVDYLQLLRGDGSGNREQEISQISRTLKQIAKELNIPIIALSQLSREVEKRADKKPLLSDLRESGSIEQDADIVGFIFRPSYYGFDTDESGNPIAGDYAELIVAKFRNGSTGVIPLKYKGAYTMFSDPETTWNQSVGTSIKQNSDFLRTGDAKDSAPF